MKKEKVFIKFIKEMGQDKITMVPYEDIEKLTNIEKVNKDDTETNI